MIVLDQRESALKCTICEELEGIDRRSINNEAALMMLTHGMEIEHRICEDYADNPRKAQIERGYRTRMRALMARELPQ